MMTKNTFIYTTVYILVISAVCYGQFSVAVSSSLLTEQVAVGDTAEAEIFILFQDNPAFWLFDSVPPPDAVGLKFLSTITKTETHCHDDSISGKTTITLRYSPTRTGDLTISPWRWRIFHIQNGDTTQIDTLELDFTGFAITGLPAPEKSVGILPFILILFGIIIVLAVGFFVYRAVKKAKSEPLKPSRPPTPAERALDEINRLSPQRTSAEQILDELSKIIRKYIAEKFGIPASGMSSDEILSALSERGLAGQKFVALKQVLKYCDDVRFAEKYPETEDIRDAIGQAKLFITG